jgi:hypothetical protein
VKQHAIAVGADHAWQVMPHGAERADKKEDVLRAPSGLGCSENGDEQYGRSNEKKKVAPSVENPERSFRYWLRPRFAYAGNSDRR